MKKPKSLSFINKATALFILISFSTSLLYPAGAYSQTVSAQTSAETVPQKTFQLASFNLPKELGAVEERQSFNSEKSVIIIQDAHAEGAAQKSVLGLTDYLSSQQDIQLFALEGAAGKLDPVFFRSFPEYPRLKKVFESYLNSGELSGAAAGAVLNKKQAAYYGAEDPELYKQGIQLFLQASEESASWQKELSDIRKQTESLKRGVYSPQLLELDRNIKNFESQTRASEALRFILAQPETEKIDLTGYPHIAALAHQLGSAAQSAESRKRLMDFTKTLRLQNLSRNEITRLNKKIQEFQTERCSASEYAGFLFKVARLHQQKIPAAIVSAAEAADLLSKARGSVFYEELYGFLRELKEHYSRTEAERFLTRLDEEESRLEKMAELKLARKEWESIKSQQALEIPDTLSNSSLSAIARELQSLKKHFQSSTFSQFYENAESREKALHAHLLDLMSAHKVKTSVLVVGGFHAQGVMELLKKENISYALITPAMPTLEKENHYRDYMKGDVSWKKYFEIKNQQIDLFEAFARAGRDRLLGRENGGKENGASENRPLLKLWRDEIIRNLSAEKNIERAPELTRWIDESLQGSKTEDEEILKKQWLAKVENFIHGLEKIYQEGHYDREHLYPLLGQTVPKAAIEHSTAVGSLVPGAVSADLVTLSKSAAERARTAGTERTATKALKKKPAVQKQVTKASAGKTPSNAVRFTLKQAALFQPQVWAAEEIIKRALRSETRRSWSEFSDEDDRLRLHFLEHYGLDISEIQPLHKNALILGVDSEYSPGFFQDLSDGLFDRFRNIAPNQQPPVVIGLRYMGLAESPVPQNPVFSQSIKPNLWSLQATMRGYKTEHVKMGPPVIPYVYLDQDDWDLIRMLEDLRDLNANSIELKDKIEIARKALARSRKISPARVDDQEIRDRVRNHLFREALKELLAHYKKQGIQEPMDEIARKFLKNSYVVFRYTSEYGSLKEMDAFMKALQGIKVGRPIVVFTMLNPQAQYQPIQGPPEALQAKLYQYLKGEEVEGYQLERAINFVDARGTEPIPAAIDLDENAVTVINNGPLPKSIFNKLFLLSDVAVGAGDGGLSTGVAASHLGVGPVFLMNPHPHVISAMRQAFELQWSKNMDEGDYSNPRFQHWREFMDAYFDAQGLGSQVSPAVSEGLQRIFENREDAEDFRFVLGRLIQNANAFNVIQYVGQKLDEHRAITPSMLHSVTDPQSYPTQLRGFQPRPPQPLKNMLPIIWYGQAVTGSGDALRGLQQSQLFEGSFIYLADRNPKGSRHEASLERSLDKLQQVAGKKFKDLNFLYITQDGRFLKLTKRPVTLKAQAPRTEMRRQLPLYKNQKSLLLRMSKDWKQIRKQGFISFDMQKTLVARKEIASPEMVDLLAWLLEQEIRIVINSGNTQDEVRDQVITPLLEALRQRDNLAAAEKLTVYSNSGTLKTTFNRSGEEQPHLAYQAARQLSQALESPLRNAMKEMAKKKFFTEGNHNALERLMTLYRKDEAKSGGKTKFKHSWVESGVYDPPIVGESLPAELEAPYIQLRSFAPGGYATKIGITRLLPEKRTEAVTIIKESIEKELGVGFLAKLSVGLGGESTVDIVSSEANKALAFVDYVESERAAGRPVNLNYAYYGGDEITLNIHGEKTGAKGDHPGNDAIVFTFPYKRGEFKKIKGIAVTSEVPVGFSRNRAKRIYYLGDEERGTQRFFTKLRKKVESRAGRSEIRAGENKARFDEPFLFGLHEANPDWWIMRILGASLITASRIHRTDAVTFEQIKDLALPRLRGQDLPEEDMTDMKLKSLLLRLQNQVKLIQETEGGKWKAVSGSEKLLITQTAAIDVVMDDLLEVLERLQKGDPSAPDYFYTLMEEYSAASEHWHLFETESRWAVEKAFVMLLKKDQKILTDLLKKAPDKLKSRGLVDSVLRLSTREVPPDWAVKNTPHLVGSTIFYISPETWLAAGGLGRVGQYHTVKLKELMGDHAGVATIESYYWKPDPENPGQYIPIDYEGVAIPVRNLQKETEFTIRVNKKGRRETVTVEVFKGTNDKGIEVYMLRDKPEPGQAPYFVRQLYKYTDRKNPERESASRSEYIEFMSKASLKLVKKVNKKIREERQAADKPYAPPVIWNNDGQTIPTSVFKRISDILEKLTPEQKQLLLTTKHPDLTQLAALNPQAYEKVKRLFKEDQSRMAWILEEFKDLIQEADEDSLLDAVTHSTTHTYLNRGWEPFEDLMQEWAIPKAFYRFFESVVYPGQADPSRALAAADTGGNGVASSHAQEVGPAHNPENLLQGIANGDHLEATEIHLVAAAKLVMKEHPKFKNIDLDEPPAEFIPLVKEKSKELWLANLRKLLTAQIAAEKDLKKKAVLQKDLKVLGEMSTQKPTGSYSGRGQEEKVDLLEVFTEENLRTWAQDGGQIVLYANVQANRGSEELFAELKRRQDAVNTEAEKNPSWGRILIVTGWNQDEQKYLMAASDFSIYVSERKFKTEKWGTEAAGRTEANYSLFYAMNIVAVYIEGLFTVEGAIRDRNHPGRGNIILSPRHEEAFYRRTVSRVIQDWKEAFVEGENLENYTKDLIVGRRMSRVFDAGLPAGQYARTFNEAMGAKRHPVETLEQFLSGDSTGLLYRNEWIREALTNALKEDGAQAVEIPQRGDAGASAFSVKLLGKEHLAVIASGVLSKDKKVSAKIKNDRTQALRTVLLEKMHLSLQDQVEIRDAVTGESLGIHQVDSLLSPHLYSVSLSLDAENPVRVFSFELVPAQDRLPLGEGVSAVLSEGSYSLEDAQKIFNPEAAQFNWWRSVNSLITHGDRGLTGFMETFLRLSAETPEDAAAGLRHHASRGEIFSYLQHIFSGLSSGADPISHEIKRLSLLAENEQDIDKKVKINLYAMDLADRYLQGAAAFVFEGYWKAAPQELFNSSKIPTAVGQKYQKLFSNIQTGKRVARYLAEEHPYAKETPTNKKGIRVFVLTENGTARLALVNAGEVTYPDDKKVLKAWGQLLFKGEFQAMLNALLPDDSYGAQPYDAKTGEEFRFYPKRHIVKNDLSIGVPGIQVLEFHVERDESLREVPVVETNSWNRIREDIKKIREAALSKNNQALEKLLPAGKNIATQRYSRELLPAVMQLVAGLAPDMLERIKNWDLELFDELSRVLSENEEVLKKGKLSFAQPRNEEGDNGAITFSYAIDGGRDGKNIIFHIDFDHQLSRTDGKAWSTVRQLMSPEGLNLELDAIYQVHDLIDGVNFNPKIGRHLARHWDIGVPIRTITFNGNVIQKPRSGAIYQLRPMPKKNFPTPAPAAPRQPVLPANEMQVFEFNTRAYFEENGIRDWNDFTLEMLNDIRRLGFNTIWPMGIYEESPQSRFLNEWWGRHDGLEGRAPSSFAIPDYIVNMGGPEKFKAFVQRAKQAGLRAVIVDFIPNHVAMDSPLIGKHPDWFIHRTVPPEVNFDNGQKKISLTDEGENPLRKFEADYFKYELPDGRLIWVAHGRDGGPWGDTAQFNLLNPEVWQYFKQTLFDLAALTGGDGVRADSLQVLLPREYRNRWFPYMENSDFENHLYAISRLVFDADPHDGPNPFGALFDTVKKVYPDFKIIGEVYHEQHGEWQRSSVDVTYGKYVYDWIVKGEGGGWGEFKNYVLRRGLHEGLNLEYLLRSYYFLEDHDQRIRILKALARRLAHDNLQRERARLGRDLTEEEEWNQLQPFIGKAADWSKVLAVAIATIPGIPMIYAGQEIGRFRHSSSADWVPPKNFLDAQTDTKVEGLSDFYRNLFRQTQEPLFRHGSLPEEVPVISGRNNDELLVFVRRYEGKAALVVLNHAGSPADIKLDLSLIGHVPLSLNLPERGTHIVILEDRTYRGEIRSDTNNIIKSQPASRSELREADLILDSLITGTVSPGQEEVLTLPINVVIPALRRQAQKPQRVDLYKAYVLKGGAKEKLMANHPYYGRDITGAIQRMAVQTAASAKQALAVNARATLNYETVLSLESADSEARENIHVYLKTLKEIEQLKAEYPKADIRVKVFLMTKKAQEEDPDWAVFFSEAASLGIVKRVTLDGSAKTAMEIQDFLGNSRALIYGLSPEAAKGLGLEASFQPRIVDSQLDQLNEQLPVAFEITNGLAKQEALKAEEIQEATLRLAAWGGMLIPMGKGLLITTDALNFIYQTYLSAEYTATMA